jgi:hypothetical protein
LFELELFSGIDAPHNTIEEAAKDRLHPSSPSSSNCDCLSYDRKLLVIEYFPTLASKSLHQTTPPTSHKESETKASRMHMSSVTREKIINPTLPCL